MLIVCKDQNQIVDEGIRYSTINEAVNAAGENETIKIYPGEYFERVEIKTKGLKLIGESGDNTRITYNLGAFEILEDGTKRGTFRSYTVYIDAPDVYMENITLENSAGDGREVGQALALYAEGDGLHFKNCRFLAHQDTIFTGPLPPMEVYHGGFVGPKEFAPRINGRQWYENCYIEGDVDFIFGSASVLFSDCTICSLNRNMEPNGYVTAPSTPQGQTYGYVFKNCDFISNECADNSVYLSRPWREYAKCIWINCSFGKHIKTEGLHDWNKPKAHELTYYAEYPFADGRVAWMHEAENIDFWTAFSFENMTLN